MLHESLKKLIYASLAFTVLAFTISAAEWASITRHSGWRQHSMSRPKPPVVTPPKIIGQPPADALILFDGHSLDQFETQKNGKPVAWTLRDDYFEVNPGSGAIFTKQSFGDAQFHLEWASPNPPIGVGQDRGNTGVFLMDNFEIQILDSYKADTYADGQAGSIYGQYPPLANASLPPGQWQTYDIVFRRPRFDPSGQLTEPARITVIHNGIVVQNNEIAYGPTSWLKFDPYSTLPEKGPIQFQDHGHKVRFRNIWIRELPDRPIPDAQELKPIETIKVDPSEIAKLAGEYRISTKPGAKPLNIKAAVDHLLIKYPNRLSILKLVPVAKNTYQFTETDARFVFSEDGKSIKFHIGGESRDIQKIE
ncbi:MAG: DUF1080 domain-containing protein [Planctomycetota bacterium]|nr:DUF1080 domain-containing protein [Planctomycetota bacterium]